MARRALKPHRNYRLNLRQSPADQSRKRQADKARGKKRKSGSVDYGPNTSPRLCECSESWVDLEREACLKCGKTLKAMSWLKL